MAEQAIYVCINPKRRHWLVFEPPHANPGLLRCLACGSRMDLLDKAKEVPEQAAPSPAQKLRFAMELYMGLTQRANEIEFVVNELQNHVNPSFLIPGLRGMRAKLKEMANRLPEFFGEAQSMPEYVTLIAQVPPGWSYTSWQEHLAALVKAEEEKALARAEEEANRPDNPCEVRP